VLKTNLGTEGYKAPEVYSEEYQGEKADVFSLGVVLFIMYAGVPPFDKACPRDRHYSMHIKDKHDAFWACYERVKPKNFFSHSFKNLINLMFSPNPLNRPTISDIQKHAWMEGPIFQQAELEAEFALRKPKFIRAK
jgi:serine/threonine protein kinase